MQLKVLFIFALIRYDLSGRRYKIHHTTRIFSKEKHPREIERLYSFVGKEVLTFIQNTRRHISEYRKHLKATVLSYYLVFGKCLSYGPPDRATVGISEWAEDEGLVDRELQADPLNNPPAHT